MSLIEVLWLTGTITSACSVFCLLSVYRSMEQSLDVLTKALHEMIIQQGVQAYGTAIQRVAEDTKVEQ